MQKHPVGMADNDMLDAEGAAKQAPHCFQEQLHANRMKQAPFLKSHASSQVEAHPFSVHAGEQSDGVPFLPGVCHMECKHGRHLKPPDLLRNL
jgi:hypothetical protein